MARVAYSLSFSRRSLTGADHGPGLHTVFFSLLQIIWIDVVLSSDNALVIAMACRSLPQRQRRWAIFLGAAAAAALRIFFTLIFLQLLAIPLIRLAGGMVLLWIAANLVSRDKPEDVAAPDSIFRAIRIIVVADAVMSLDNVIAIAGAAQGAWPLIIFGLGLSIPLVVFGAALLVPALNRFPALIWIGAGILGWVAGELIGSDPVVFAFLHAKAPAVALWHLAVAGVGVALLLGWLSVRNESPDKPATD